MTRYEIKSTVDAGQIVHWANTSYRVHKDRLGQYLITYVPNGSTIGLTNRSGGQLNGEETEFFIAGSESGDEEGPDSRRKAVGRGGAFHKAERQCDPVCGCAS